MSKIISMPSNNIYRENWDRIFGKDDSNHAEAETRETVKITNCTGRGCGCGKKNKDGKA